LAVPNGFWLMSPALDLPVAQPPRQTPAPMSAIHPMICFILVLVFVGFESLE
jgi:hypothetical protein